MSIQEQISRITSDRNTIRNKMVELGVAAETDNLTTLATKIDGIANNGAVSVEILEGKSYTIPKGWHNGAGIVKAMTDVEGEAEQYKTQSKTVTPTKNQQSVGSDEGYYALESVIVEPIPAAYQDVTGVTATADKVLTGAVYVDKDGTVTAGTMPNNGSVLSTLNPQTTGYIVPKGYHSGMGMISVAVEEKSVTPTKEEQVLTATTKFMNKVTVAPIPDEYQDVTEVTATAGAVMIGEKFVDAEGNVVEGTMPIYSGDEITLSTTNTSHYLEGGYYEDYNVSITLDEKTMTPTKVKQTALPDTGKVLAKVVINPIPAAYQDITVTTADAAHVLDGKFFVNNVGNKTEGTMPNNGAIAATIVGLDSTNDFYTIPAGYHNGSGKVSLTSDIEELLAAI